MHEEGVVKPNNKQMEAAFRIPELMEKAFWFFKVTEDRNGIALTVCEKHYEANGIVTVHKYGIINGIALRVCKEVVYYMLSTILDDLGNPMGLQVLFDGRITYRGDVPLDVKTGNKMALLSILLPTIKIEKKAEVIAWRVERMTEEEAIYWLTKVTVPSFGDRAMAWAKIGLRVLLAGPTDQKEDFDDLLDKLRR